MELRPGTPEEAGMSAERVQRIVNLAESWVEHGITPALVILAARRGVIVAHRAFGRLTAADDSPPLELDSIFPLASLTKPITATAAMILVEEGLLSLNRPVQWYIPEFVGEGKSKVMVHHLMTHTSGLKQDAVYSYIEEKRGKVEIPSPDKNQHPRINESLESLFLMHDAMYDAPLWRPPGTEMSYCDYNLVILAEIVRRISGGNIADFARERIFRPLGMRDSFYIVTDPVEHSVVKRPEDAPGHFYDSRDFQKLPAAAAGVYSTAMDMAVFGQMLLNHGIYSDTRILSPASVSAMTRNQIPGISSHWRMSSSLKLLGDSVGVYRAARRIEALCSRQRYFMKGGFGGTLIWVDPIYEIVGCYFSVMLENDKYAACDDLFMNAVTGAIVE